MDKSREDNNNIAPSAEENESSKKAPLCSLIVKGIPMCMTSSKMETVSDALVQVVEIDCKERVGFLKLKSKMDSEDLKLLLDGETVVCAKCAYEYRIKVEYGSEADYRHEIQKAKEEKENSSPAACRDNVASPPKKREKAAFKENLAIIYQDLLLSNFMNIMTL